MSRFQRLTNVPHCVAIGRDGGLLVMVPYDEEGETVTPVTVHLDAAADHPSAADREVQGMKPKMAYFSQEDVLHLVISEED